jgi:hypothetical protein
MMLYKTQMLSGFGLRFLQSLALMVVLHAQAQAQAMVNVAGGTSRAGVVVASDDGSVGIAALPNDAKRHVALNVYEPAFLQSGPLQPLYSKLIPITSKHGLMRHSRINKANVQVMKQISQTYLKVQSEHGGMVVDVLPILVRGEKRQPDGKGMRSDIFAKFIVQQLINNGVKNVHLNHVPQNDVITRDPTQRTS